MCVLALAWNCHPRYRLLLIGNRDEAYDRPAAPLARWRDVPGVLAGRDLQAGGTWMGVCEPDRAAVVTNVRAPQAPQDGASRGLLVSDFLRAGAGALMHGEQLATTAARYHPFNLLLFDAGAACFVSNYPQVRVQALAAGIHGLSNGALDAPWPKVQRARAALEAWLAGGGDTDCAALFTAFAERAAAPDAELPDTGVGLALERQLSPVFVAGERYGTCATTVMALERAGGGFIIERRFGQHGVAQGQTVMRCRGAPA